MNFPRIYLLLLLACASCANLTTPPYGHVSADDEPFSLEINKAILPQGAPSISQGYKPYKKANGKLISIASKDTGGHEGIDILHSNGTPVLAAADGTITSSTFGPLFGNQVVIAHGLQDDGLYYKTKYFHLQDRFVKAGDFISRGQQIGTLGMTGFLSGGFAHLHFEVRTGMKPNQRLTESVHPHKYWVDGIGLVTCFDIEKIFPDNPFKITYPVPCAGVRWKAWGEKNRPK